MMYASREALDAEMEGGLLSLLGDKYRIELRTEQFSKRPLPEPHGDLLRWFEIEGPPRRISQGLFELVRERMVSRGPRGILGHVRVATWDRRTIWEGDLEAVKGKEEQKASTAAIVFLMPTLEVVDDQPIEMVSFEWGWG